jgi:hypothetical protein
MEKIHVVNNFINPEESAFFIKLINNFEVDHADLFSFWQDGKRIALPFGNVKNELVTGVIAQPDLTVFGEDEEKLRSVLRRATDRISEDLGMDDDLYIASFWLAKQYPGSIIAIHSDLDDGMNSHFEHSGLIYLNTMTVDGQLVFPDLDYSYSPVSEDLVFFPCTNTGKHFVEKISEDRYSLVFWTTKDKSLSL